MSKISIENIKALFKKVNYKTIIYTLILLVFVSFSGYCVYRDHRDYAYEVYRSENELEMIKTKALIVEEINKYIKSAAPMSSLNGIAIFDACEEYGVDIKFVLAQGHQESHFGTAGMAAKTNSVFNVLAYDGRTAEDMKKKGHAFKHPDESIRPYLKLLTDKYLVNGKTEKDMFKKFTDKSGNRYASDPSYEQKLLNRYQYIDSTTNITALMEEYNRYKIITNND